MLTSHFSPVSLPSQWPNGRAHGMTNFPLERTLFWLDQKDPSWVWRDSSAVLHAHCSSRGSVWFPAPISGGSQSPITPVLGDQILSSGLHRHLCIYHNTHTKMNVCMCMCVSVSVCICTCICVYVYKYMCMSIIKNKIHLFQRKESLFVCLSLKWPRLVFNSLFFSSGLPSSGSYKRVPPCAA